MANDLFGRAWLILVFAALLLGSYSWIHQRLPWLQTHFRGFDLPGLAAFRSDTLALTDSLEEEDPNVPIVLYTGWPHLVPFFQKLRKGSGQIRIAYFGDSSIEGDLMTQSLRDSLQSQFGGQGVGFLPFTAVSPGFRLSVRHRFSPNWTSGVIGQPDSSGFPYGINGHWYLPAGDSLVLDSLPPDADSTAWVRYIGTSKFAHTGVLPRLRLFYGARPAEGDSLVREEVSELVSLVCDRDTLTYLLSTGEQFASKWLSRKACRQITLVARAPSRLLYYGFDAGSRGGLLLDNFGLRGNAGGPLLDMPADMLRQFQRWLGYDLLVFQFGANMIEQERTDYSAYRQELRKLIRHFRKAMPGVPVLLVGLPDKATKIRGTMRTDPSIPRIHRAQRQAAQDEGVAFFSFYHAMGGSGSMIRWVEAESPAMATSDYTHFTFRGGKYASRLWLDYLLTGYDQYLRQPDSLSNTREILPHAHLQ